MKPYFVYGSINALINALATLVIYLAGLHSDPEKLSTAGYISMTVGLGSGIWFMVAGVRSKRNLTPPTDNFTFGMALGVSITVSLIATALYIAFQFIYQSFINPGFIDVMLQSQAAAMQAHNVPAEQAEKAEQVMRFMMKPSIQAITGFITYTVTNVIISLIIAAIMRRKATEEPLTSPPAL